MSKWELKNWHFKFHLCIFWNFEYFEDSFCFLNLQDDDEEKKKRFAEHATHNCFSSIGGISVFSNKKIIRKRIFRKWICLFWERARKSIFQRLCHFVLWQVFTFIILSRRAFKLLWRYTYELRLDNSCSIWQISTNVKILQVDCQIVNCHF